MRKIVIFALVMFPSIILGKTHKIDNNRQLSATHQHLILVLLKEAINDKNGSYWVHSGDTIRNIEEILRIYVEENGVTEVCGVPFGSSYEKTKKMLMEKYGECDKQNTTKDCLSFSCKRYEGLLFSKLSFMFERNGETSHLNKAEFRVDTKTKEEALQLKKLIDEKLSKRFKIYKVLDEGEIHLSVGGICPAPFDGNPNDYGFTVDIQKHEKPTRNGNMYVVRIIYGPYKFNFIAR